LSWGNSRLIGKPQRPNEAANIGHIQGLCDIEYVAGSAFAKRFAFQAMVGLPSRNLTLLNRSVD